MDHVTHFHVLSRDLETRARETRDNIDNTDRCAMPEINEIQSPVEVHDAEQSSQVHDMETWRRICKAAKPATVSSVLKTHCSYNTKKHICNRDILESQK